mmetsp:Transcript_2034/g.3177  ORF Transcript_2034/g.3177 Transcript_2034/m.3177 type:complete len:150 (-) Transcript_2034:58-507(-)
MAAKEFLNSIHRFIRVKHALAMLRAAGIIGASATIGYSLYMLIFRFEFFLAFMYVYLILFAICLILSETGSFECSRFRAYFLFLSRFTGRGLFYIFVAGLLLNGWGIFIACWLIGVGILHIFVSISGRSSTTLYQDESPNAVYQQVEPS